MRTAKLGLLALILVWTATPASAAKPNFLFIVVDDLNCDVACYGHPRAKTPHLDAVAAAGVRFERAYTQVPSCNGSRASFLTGRYPTATGVFDNETSHLDALPDAVTLPRHFRNQGYRTARVGKIAHARFQEQEAWSLGAAESLTPPGPPGPRKKSKNRKTDLWAISWGGADRLWDRRVSDRAIEMLRELRGEPFLLAVGFSSPHPPLLAPREYFAKHPSHSIKLPDDFAATPPQGGPAFRPNRGLFFRRSANHKQARQMIAAYRAATSFFDAELGRVIGELDRLELREQTVVIVVSDHGFHLGEKGLWAKSTLFEPALRVPLVVAGPGIATGASPRTVELVDLYPTMVELSGIAAPAVLDGQSLVPLLKDPSAAWSRPARSWLRRKQVLGSSVRTERYRYTRWADDAGPEELYDHETDPHERWNLAAEPEQRDRIAQLRGLLEATPRR